MLTPYTKKDYDIRLTPYDIHKQSQQDYEQGIPPFEDLHKSNEKRTMETGRWRTL